MKQELKKFIETQKERFEKYDTGINWNDNKWDVRKWLPIRGNGKYLKFTDTSKNGLNFSEEYSSFMKAFCVYMYWKRRIGYIAINNYGVELTRHYKLIMYLRGETSPTQLTKWHFERALELRKEQGYKNLYDSISNLKLIADTLDELNIPDTKIQFEHRVKPNEAHYKHKELSKIEDDNYRDDTKLPSFELFSAYAKCTNNPINDNEEILLRTIDLLIATGQRGNEVAVIPFDCMVFREKRNKDGKLIRDENGNIIYSTGIKYYAEKNFEEKIHYLADQDIGFVCYVVQKLKILTKEAREVAKWQENNPNRVWDIDPCEIIDDDIVIKYLQYKSLDGLHLFLQKHNVKILGSFKVNDSKIKHSNGRRVLKRQCYKAGDIEQVLLKLIPDHNDFRVNNRGNVKTVLKTSEILSVRFNRAFAFKRRSSNIFKVFPHRTKLVEINQALGANPQLESIFERRGLTEADGSKIKTTSHSFRHWRNTIYHLTGMSNVQQALSLGRKDLSQNTFYQHETLREKTEQHRNFLNYSNTTEKLIHLRNGIREKKILGPMSDLYHKIKKQQNSNNAEEFLKTHANALHLTPYGGCTHDFSQTPCLKHLQCWNGCSHLHRLGGKEETNNLTKLLNSFEELIKHQEEQEIESIWNKGLRTKITNLKQALDMKLGNSPTPVFPNEKPLHGLKLKKSSIKNQNEKS